MKTKTLLITTILLSLAVFFAACSDKDNGSIKKGNLPENAINFLERYFPDNEITDIQFSEIVAYNTLGYIVNLQGDIVVHFASGGQWHKIEASGGIPESAKEIIGSNTLKQLNEVEKNYKITLLTDEFTHLASYGKLIVLDNGHEYWDMKGLEGSALGTVVPKIEVIKPIKDFIDRNGLATAAEGENILKITESKGDVYCLMLGGLLACYFDNMGKFIYAKLEMTSAGPSPLLSKIAFQEVPENVFTIIGDAALFSNIHELALFANGIYGFKNSTSSYLVNEAEGEIINKDGEIVIDFVKEYYPNQKVNDIRVEAQFNNPYTYSFKFVLIQNMSQAAVVFMDKNGNWTEVTTENVLSEKFLKSLPAKLGEYLKANHATAVFYRINITGDNQKAYRLLTQRFYIFFDMEGNFLEKRDIIAE